MRGKKPKISCQTGNRFGKLIITNTFTDYTPSGKKELFCDCVCDCGNKTLLRASALRYDNKKSCGCLDGRGSRTLAKVGEKYGKLTIVKVWSHKFSSHKSKEKVCKCKCDCGKVVTVRARYIRKGQKKSCGCLRHLGNKNTKQWTGYGEISGSFWSGIKKSSKRKSRTIPFKITIKQIWDLFLKQERKCALSGIPIGFSEKYHRRGKKYKNKYTAMNTASLDRIDSSKGYTIDNVQWVHKEVNNMKQALSQDKFINWCRLISNCQKP